MSDDKKPSFKDPVGWFLRSSVALLFAVIALNLAITYLKAVLPWLIGGAALICAAWSVSAFTRWRKSRW